MIAFMLPAGARCGDFSVMVIIACWLDDCISNSGRVENWALFSD